MINRKTKTKSNNILKPSRWREYVAILLIVFSVLLIFGLFSYNVGDFDNLDHGKPANYIGNLGVIVSYYLFHCLGIATYVIPPLVITLAIMIFKRFVLPSQKTIFINLAAIGVFLITLSCLAHILYPETIKHLNVYAGGIIGNILATDFLLPFCGRVGAFILLLGLALIELLFIFDASLRSFWAGTLKVSKILLSCFLALKNFAFDAILWMKNKLSSGSKIKTLRPKRVETKIVITGLKQSPKRKRRDSSNIASEMPVVQPAKTAPVIEAISAEEREQREAEMPPYKLPSIMLLDEAEEHDTSYQEAEVSKATDKLHKFFEQFGIDAKVVHVICGPVVTLYEVQPAPGVKVSSITKLEDDMALAMKATSIRIVAPIPGKDAVGIELPNKKRQTVMFSELIDCDEYEVDIKNKKLMLSLGKTLSGKSFSTDLAGLPHLLVAGATGSGKSVCINTILLSLLLKYKPNELKLILVDPKHVELIPYHNLPHLLLPVLNDSDEVPGALQWLIDEMEFRYKYFARLGVRNIDGFNQNRKANDQEIYVQMGAAEKKVPDFIPYIVLIIDEFADLMITGGKEVENGIVRLAQKARAAGIHMILATQRPSADVFSSLIKNNIPARIAFRTSSGNASRVILDEVGSEKLLGKGDMLYNSPDISSTIRVQGAFVSDAEVENFTNFIREQRQPSYVELESKLPEGSFGDIELDARFDEAINVVIDTGQASSSNLQRRLKVGYARAASLIDMMEAQGIVGPKNGAKPRTILVEEWPPEFK